MKSLFRTFDQTRPRFVKEDTYDWPAEELPKKSGRTFFNDRELIARQARGVAGAPDRVVGPLRGPGPTDVPTLAFEIKAKGERIYLHIHNKIQKGSLKRITIIGVVFVAVGFAAASPLGVDASLVVSAFVALVMGCFVLIEWLCRETVYREFTIHCTREGLHTLLTRRDGRSRPPGERLDGAPEPTVLENVYLNPSKQMSWSRPVYYEPGRWCVLALVIEDAVVFARFDREPEPIRAAALEYEHALEQLRARH